MVQEDWTSVTPPDILDKQLQQLRMKENISVKKKKDLLSLVRFLGNEEDQQFFLKIE